ncbi:MAG: ABC transporter substrate-binding protein [Polyangiaceae bacterium]|nr:ABC transporter substrate-binding protein [Polyangiaceae bacterium]
MRHLAPSFVLLASLSACSRAPRVAQHDDRSLGVGPKEIVIGSSAALSGHAAFLGTQTLHGSLAKLRDVNEKGGVHGRTIRLVSLDDGYDPARAVTNTQQLLVDDRVFALFDYVGTPTSVKIIDLTERARVPALGFFTGAEPLRTPHRRWMFHVRDSYYAEAEGAVALLVDRLRLPRIGVLYQEDAFGQAVLAGLQLALKRRGASPVAVETYARGTMDVEKARDALVAAGADAICMVGTYAPLAKFVKLVHDKGARPWFHTVSFVGSEAFGKELAVTQKVAAAEHPKIVVTQVVPSPFADDFPAVREYRMLAKKYYPDDPPNYVALEGYLNASVLVRALEAAGPNLDRDRFVDALEHLSGVDLGIGKTLGYGPTQHAGLSGIYYSRLNEDGTFRLFLPEGAAK